MPQFSNYTSIPTSIAQQYPKIDSIGHSQRKMQLKDRNQLELPATADMHVHLRQDKLMELVTPQIRNGGVDTVFVMVSDTWLG